MQKKIEREYKDYFNQYKDNLKIGGIKIFLDGSPQAKTAWLRDEYENDEKYYGYKILKDEDIEQVLKKQKRKIYKYQHIVMEIKQQNNI